MNLPTPRTSIVPILQVSPIRYRDDNGNEQDYFTLADCNGMILTHQQLADLVATVRPFYAHFTDDEIADANTEFQETCHEARSQAAGASDAQQVKPTERDTRGWVYIIEAKRYSLYKIGMTTRTPTERLADFEPLLPFRTSILRSVRTDDAYQLERELHTRFADKRVNGEWFELEPDDVAYIKGLANGQVAS